MADYKKFDFKKLYFILYILLVLCFVFLVFKLGMFLLPFVIALFLSIMIEPVSKLMVDKLKLSNKLATILSLVLMFLVLFGLIGIAFLKLAGEVYNLSHNLDVYTAQTTTLWNDGLKLVNKYLGYFPKEFTNEINLTIGKIATKVSTQISFFTNKFITLVTSIPTMILYVAITVLSTFFISLDKDKIWNFLEHQFPEVWLEKVYSIKTEMFTVVGSYIKAQLILVSLCFIELFVALNLLAVLNFDVKYPLLMSIIISVVDALPVLGAGAILIPWALIALALGDVPLGIAIFVVYILVVSVRQTLEPKLISQNIGVHPLITIISMYSGFKIIGVMGFLVGPIVMIILKNVFSRELEVGFFKEIFSNNNEQ